MELARTTREVEATPASYPATPDLAGYDAARRALIWQRIDSYIAYRFSVREVVWTVEGSVDAEWVPRLGPVEITSTEVWESGAWTDVTLPEGPYGLCLPGDGPYRITANVGGGDIPSGVQEAFRRLAEYSDDTEKHSGESERSFSLGGALQESYSRSPTWLARAMVNSGAADLLRPYRRYP